MTATTDSPRWFKSSYSGNGGTCVEVAANPVVPRGAVSRRGSQVPDGGRLGDTPQALSAFVGGVY
ncbi:DUF397 domain-containing protein [Streptomyces sp. NPDC058953]|uniref:DUF397 domain-containing protein n=1 Tax=Streptomyces sp. NPDC058953 TaxID=3346676 RepID=UPI0036C9EDFE